MNTVRAGSSTRVHRGVDPCALAQADHLVDELEVHLVRAEHAAQHAVGVAHVDHHRADQRVPAAHLDLRVRLRDALALRQPVVLGPVGLVARVEIGIDHLEIDTGLEAQSEPLDPALEDRRPADEDRLREALVDDDLHGAQHALVLAFRVDDPPRAPSWPPRRSASSAGRSDRRTASAARDTRRSRRSAASRRRSPSPPWPRPARSSR